MSAWELCHSLVSRPMKKTTMVPVEAQQVSTSSELIDLWLHGKSYNTVRTYRREVLWFLSFVEKGAFEVSLGDVQAFATYLEESSGLSSSSVARTLSTVKSFLSFGNKIGVLPSNVGAAVKLPAAKNTLAMRILPESNVQVMIALETNPRNRAILKLLYGAGLRVSELCALKWRDLQARAEVEFPGQVIVYGKGNKTRVVALTSGLWQELMLLRSDAGPDKPVFVSRNKGGHLSTTQVGRIVKAAALRTPGLDPRVAEQVSPHWLRHAHASHALDRGAPIHLVQQTLGHASIATTGMYLHAKPSDSSARFLSVL
ncbi:MAG: tyrosine-type recombinase/integrase [Xenococcaceae cyanobacterium]